MSISNINLVKERVQQATVKSKIAVFVKSRGATRELDAVFDSTYNTRKRIQIDDKYVGSYEASMNISDVMSELHKALRG